MAAAVAEIDAEPAWGRESARALGFVCALSMITYLDRACFGMALRPIAGELGLRDVSELKWAITSFAIAYAIFEIPAGAMGDRLGAKAMLTRIVLWWSAFTAMTGLIGLRVGPVALGGVGTLVALRFLFGAGEAGAYPNITRALHERVPPAKWETAQGLVFMSGRLCGGLTPLLWAFLVGGVDDRDGLVSWRVAFLIFGMVGVTWAVAFRLGFHDRPRARRTAAGSHGSIPWRALATSPVLWALCVMYLMANYAWAFNFTYLPSYVEQRFGVGSDDALGAIAKGAPLWFGATGCLLGGPAVELLARRTGDRRLARRRLGVAAMLLGACCWWGASRATGAYSFCVLVSLSAFSIDVTLGAAWASCQDLGRSHAAVTAACMNTIGTLGSALNGWLTGTAVGGAIAARAAATGVAPAALAGVEKTAAAMAGYDAAFVSYMLAFLVAAACWAAVDPKRPLVADDEG